MKSPKKPPFVIVTHGYPCEQGLKEAAEIVLGLRTRISPELRAMGSGDAPRMPTRLPRADQETEEVALRNRA